MSASRILYAVYNPRVCKKLVLGEITQVQKFFTSDETQWKFRFYEELTQEMAEYELFPGEKIDLFVKFQELRFKTIEGLLCDLETITPQSREFFEITFPRKKVSEKLNEHAV